jgi:hypothetical protein
LQNTCFLADRKTAAQILEAVLIRHVGFSLSFGLGPPAIEECSIRIVLVGRRHSRRSECRLRPRRLNLPKFAVDFAH